MTRAAIKYAEGRLREAVLAGDVDALDVLSTDAVFFCAPDGEVLRKEDDLEAYRSGALVIARYDVSEMVIELHGTTAAVVVLRLELGGKRNGEPFAAVFRAVRTWVREDAHGHAHGTSDAPWRLASATLVPLPHSERA
ncbi:MAG: nuclear transport factor 2 family protein [Polyangiaceae bacterium]|nr:nuclear transport factor 2 family protein [Polyangiaceae bacterium]